MSDLAQDAASRPQGKPLHFVQCELSPGRTVRWPGSPVQEHFSHQLIHPFPYIKPALSKSIKKHFLHPVSRKKFSKEPHVYLAVPSDLSGLQRQQDNGIRLHC